MRSTRHLIRFASVSAILAAALFSSGRAHAEADTFGLGSGRTGAGSFPSGSTIINRYAGITVDVAHSATTITVDATPFNPGDLVLIWQATGLPLAPLSGLQTAVALDTTATGSFEFARVKSVAGSVVTLTNPVASLAGYTAVSSQLVFVPEFTTLTVGSGASLVAGPWDGHKGGIVAALTQQVLTNDGTISANGFGFRGGTLQNDNTVYQCAALDGPAGIGTIVGGGAHKGEGVYPADYSQLTSGAADATYGRGNVANGGGGGDCHNAGGGGGGGGGALPGGQGGNTWTGETGGGDRPVGGLGGAPLAYTPTLRMTFGGGGGAGEENNDNASVGGSGGGVVLLRVASLAGTGLIESNGADAANSLNDGAGGGGGGGLIVLRSAGGTACTGIHANGGNGGSSEVSHGPGAGGSGGIVLVQSTSGVCPSTEVAGTPGSSGAADAGSQGSQPGGGGSDIAVGGYVAGTCDVAVDHCGGCVIDTDCGGALVCNTTTNKCTLSDGGVPLGDGGLTDGGSSTGDGGSTTTDGGSSTGDGGSGNGDGGSGTGDSGLGGDGGGSGNGDGGNGNGNGIFDDSGSLEGGGCSTTGSSTDGEGAAFLGLGLVAALAMLRRKKR